MKIGELELDVGAPQAERLLASCGQSVAAMRRMLDAPLIAGLVAAALHACIRAEDELIAIPDLARHIAAHDIDEVRKEVVQLYADVGETIAQEWPVKAKGKTNAQTKEG